MGEGAPEDSGGYRVEAPEDVPGVRLKLFESEDGHPHLFVVGQVGDGFAGMRRLSSRVALTDSGLSTALWTVQAVAWAVGVTEGRIRQLLGEGRFPNASKLGRSWLIPGADVRAYFGHPDRRRKGEVRQGALPGVSE